MAFSSKVDVIPVHNSIGADHQQSQYEAKRIQRQRWKVLLSSFFLVLIVGLVWVWSRPAIYQSQAIIHFSYPQQIGKELSTVPIEQIQLNQQRLTSFRVIQELSDTLGRSGINVDAEALYGLVSTKAEVESRIITLSATGQEVSILEPILRQWLDLYLTVLATETAANTSEDIQLIQQKLQALEVKILEQRERVEAFSLENNIVSIERDENRTLNKIKGLGKSLDQAELKESQSKASLESVKQSMALGKVVIRPADQERIANVRSNIASQQAELAALAQSYTQEYMQLDPTIVRKKDNLDANQLKLNAMVEQSQKRYLEDLQRNLLESYTNQQQLAGQLDTLSVQAKAFNQKLNEYKRLTTALSQLEDQAQKLNNQAVQKEVSKPFEARLSVLEQPFIPSYPIGPQYLRDSLIVLLGAAVSAVFALLLFSFIVRQKQPPAAMTSYTVVPGSNGQTLNMQAGIAGAAAPHKLEQQQAPLQIAQSNQAPNLTLLSTDDCQQLYNAANPVGKQVIGLLLNGCSPIELGALSYDNFDFEQQIVHIAGAKPRGLIIPEQLLALFVSKDVTHDSIWQETLSKEDFDQMLINVAYDAGIPFPEQINTDALRHCYLVFLVSQGAKLNDLEQVAGYISPAQLGQYRNLNRQSALKPLAELDLSYPISW